MTRLILLGAVLAGSIGSARAVRVPMVIGSQHRGGDALIILPSSQVKVLVDAKEVNLAGTEGGVDGAIGDGHFLLRNADGTVLAWGANTQGQLGLATAGTVPEPGRIAKPVPQPTPIAGLPPVRQVAAGGSFSLALLEDGTVRAWGSNHAGQLGLGSNFPSALKRFAYAPYPIPITTLTGVKAIAAAGGTTAHALALMSDGTVRAWGSNVHGLLGVERVTQSDVPVTVPGIERAVAVATSLEYSLALLDDGTVRVWGDGTLHSANFAGAQGPSIHTEDPRPWSATPLTIPGLRGVVAIAAGANAIALLSNGTVRTWGYNGHFSMGLGHNTEYPQGLQTPKLSGVAGIAGGWNTSYFVLRDGRVLRASGSERTPTVILPGAQRP